MTDFVHHAQQHKKFTPLIRYWNWILLQNITHSFSYMYFYRIIAFPNSVCLNSQKNLGVRENLDVVIPNYFVPLCKIQLQPKLLGKTYKYKSRGIWHMGVRKKGFQLIAIPFHYFVENRLINHQRNHISSNCLSSPSNTQFTDHLVWNRAFLCMLQATLLKQETYTTPKEDKAWRDQKRVAVQHQNLHHEEQGQAGKKKNKTKQTETKKTTPLNLQMEACLLPSSGHLCWRSVLLLQRNRRSKAHPDVHKYSWCVSHSHHNMLLIYSWLRPVCFPWWPVRLLRFLQVRFLNASLASWFLSWARALLFLEDSWWCSSTQGLRRSAS